MPDRLTRPLTSVIVSGSLARSCADVLRAGVLYAGVMHAGVLHAGVLHAGLQRTGVLRAGMRVCCDIDGQLDASCVMSDAVSTWVGMRVVDGLLSPYQLLISRNSAPGCLAGVTRNYPSQRRGL